MISLQGPELAAWSTGFPVTLLHVGVTLLILLLGSVLYAVITPHRELQLVRSGNAAAALSLGGALVGLALPLAFALSASTSLENRRLSNIVFMGMGEPLYNLDNVAAALDILSDNEGIAISRRRITVSTSGVVPELKALGERTGAMLAVSMHATRDELRDQLVPINRRYPIAELMAAIRAYPGLSNAKRVTFEYVMLKGVNDAPADAKALVKLIAGIPAKINLIPFNPWPGAPFQCSDPETIEAFAAIIRRAGYASPVRKPRGRDILAACGQLRSESEKLRASARRRATASAS